MKSSFPILISFSFLLNSLGTGVTVRTRNRRVIRLNRLRITVGEHDLARAELPTDAIDVGIEKLTIHPNFNIQGYLNDVAILKLDKVIQWTPYAWPACLSNKTFQPEGRNGTVAGWGSLVDIIGGKDKGIQFPKYSGYDSLEMGII